ncbi:MAG TPA: LemA family protein [Planctomycetota bacterium]|nr:LemA family protein [Planctomycetota bacterium]
MAFLLVPLGILLLLVLWIVGVFNGLVRARNACDESWAGIDTELKRRHDLVPNLVETVKGYAAHERGTLEAVIQARNAAAAPQASPAAAAQAENTLSAGLRQIFALSERYPDLKANASFQQLQGALADTEDRIQRARTVYNGNVRQLNTSIEVFPGNMVASSFGFSRREFFELKDAEQREAPKVSFKA